VAVAAAGVIQQARVPMPLLAREGLAAAGMATQRLRLPPKLVQPIRVAAVVVVVALTQLAQTVAVAL